MLFRGGYVAAGSKNRGFPYGNPLQKESYND